MNNEQLLAAKASVITVEDGRGFIVNGRPWMRVEPLVVTAGYLPILPSAPSWRQSWRPHLPASRSGIGFGGR